MTRILPLPLLVLAACSSPPPDTDRLQGELADLSHAFDSTTVSWPTSDPFRLEPVADGVLSASDLSAYQRVPGLG